MDTAISPDGTPIVFDRSGDGPPVVLIGGALMDRMGLAPLARLLASRFTVYTYDRRGRGASGDTAPYALDRELEDLAAVLAAVGAPAFVFGHSAGGALALRAVARGSLVRKLALYEPPFITNDGRPPIPADFAGQLTALISSGRPGDALTRFLTVVTLMPAAVQADVRASPLWPGMEALAHTLVYDLAVMGDHMSGNPLPAEWAASVTLPVLVMDGGKSGAWQRHSMRDLVDLLPDPTYVTIPKADHMLVPTAVAPVLAAFFLGQE